MKILLSLFAAGMAFGPGTFAQAPVARRFEPAAPPPEPPVEFANPLGQPPKLRAAATVYSIGDPTPEEQLYVEMVNRARANPAAEGKRLAETTDPHVLQAYEAFAVDLDLMQFEFGTNTPAPPVAISPRLTAAARRHTQDMFDNVYQDHPGSDGSTPAQRVSATGYQFTATGENVYSYAHSVFYGHAGFEVDWGEGPGGMQTRLGHRAIIHNPIFRDIGVGVIVGRNERAGVKAVGPQVVTQEFGAARDAAPYITGVAYYDLNGNNFYDMGEGIGGVRVVVSGTGDEGISALSGGYAVPVPGDGDYTVTFSGPGFEDKSATVTITNRANVKLDFTPAYLPPVITGSPAAPAFRTNTYTVSPVGGASAYQWRVFQKSLGAAEGAENGTNNIEITQTEGYAVIQNFVKSGGNSAFHLAMPGSDARSQYVRLLPTYIPTASGAIEFKSRLGWAAEDQHAQVQVSQDGGANWESVYDQPGTSTQGETGFTSRTVSLAAYAGKFINLRFAYTFIQGQYFDQTDAEVGWIFDDIQFINTAEIRNQNVYDFAGGSFQFQPPQLADYSLQVRAKTGHDFLPWGSLLSLHATQPTGTPEVAVSGIKKAGTELEIGFSILAGATPSKMTLESTEELSGIWSPETVAAEETGTANYRFRITPSAPNRFYRVRAE